MSWIGQVRHVFVKDLRDSRWMLLVYLLVVAWITVGTAGWLWGSENRFLGGSFLVSLAGAYLVAAVVQGDSPTSSDAFWATHPFRRSAVLGAKVAFALLAMLIALAGQAVAVASFDVSGGEFWHPVVGGLLEFAMYLLAAMIGAALLRDLRSFTVAIVALPASWMLLTAILWTPDASSAAASSGSAAASGDVRLPASLITAPLGVAMLVWLYRRRETRAGAYVTGFVVAVLVLITAGARITVARQEPVSSETTTGAPFPIRLRDDPVDVRGAQLHLFVGGVTAPPGRRVSIRGIEAELRLRDGSVVRVPMRESFTDIVGGGAARPREPELRWIGDGNRSQGWTSVSARLTPDQRRSVQVGIDSVVLNAQVVVVDAEPLGTMPLVPGSRVSRRGYRARLEHWSTAFGEPALTIKSAALSPVWKELTAAGLWMFSDDAYAALVNPRRGEALMLYSRGASSGGGGMVLPGAHVRSRTVNYEAGWETQSADDTPQVDAAWIDGAEVLLVEQIVRGVYRVRLAADVDDATR